MSAHSHHRPGGTRAKPRLITLARRRGPDLRLRPAGHHGHRLRRIRPDRLLLPARRFATVHGGTASGQRPVPPPAPVAGHARHRRSRRPGRPVRLRLRPQSGRSSLPPPQLPLLQAGKCRTGPAVHAQARPQGPGDGPLHPGLPYLHPHHRRHRTHDVPHVLPVQRDRCGAVVGQPDSRRLLPGPSRLRPRQHRRHRHRHRAHLRHSHHHRGHQDATPRPQRARSGPGDAHHAVHHPETELPRP